MVCLVYVDESLTVAVIIYLMAEVLAASSDKHRQHNPSRLRGTRQLPEYLQPPPHFGGPSPSPTQNRPPTSKPRGHHQLPSFQNHQQKPEISKSLAQRVARWFFDSGNDEGHGQQNFGVKQQSQNWVKPNYGPPKPPRNFHGPPKPHSVYGPSRPPGFRGSNRPPQFLGPPRPGYGPPPPHTLNLPPKPNHAHRPQHQYLPLNPQSSDDQGRCNPCNKVPWVPLPHSAIAGSAGFGTGFRTIEQLPLEGFGNGQGTPEFPPFSGPSSNDRPVGGPPDSSYGPPLLPHVAPGPPFNPGNSVSGPSDSYGQPLKSTSNQYGPPYSSISDNQDLRQGNSQNQNTFNGQTFNKQHSNELAININEHFGYSPGNDPQVAATQHNSQDEPVHSVPDTGASGKFNGQGQHASNAKPYGGINDDIEIVKSVRVADFLASVDYPLEVIQSPIIDIDNLPNNSGNGDHKTTPLHHNTQSGQGDSHNGQSNRDSGRQQGSNYGNIDSNVDHGVSHNGDQKEQQATVHQVVSTANGKIIKGRPIVVESFAGDDSEENKVNTVRPHNVKGLTNLTQDREYYNKVKHTGENKYHGVGESIGFQAGTTIFDLTPSLQTQGQGTSLIHNINNLNIFTQQLPPTAPFTNNFQQRPGHVNYPLGVNSNLPSNNLFSSTVPFQNNFKHTSLPAPIDVLKDSNSNQQFNPSHIDPKPNLVTSPPLDTSSWVPISSTTNSQTTWSSKPIGKPAFNFQDNQGVASFNNAGMLPPPPPRPYQTHKKPKQIQVIVPYTSSKQLLQFQLGGLGHSRPSVDNTGWLPLRADDDKLLANQARKVSSNNCSTILRDNSFIGQEQWQKCREYSYGSDHQSNNAVSQGFEEDYHQHEESRTVTATIAQTPRPLNPPTAGGIHHIFAPNIRALLKGEEDRTSPEALMFKLQKNIDEWTALEYSSGKGPEKIRDDERKGTTSLLHLLVPSKKIPDAYLTTTPSTFDDETSENMVATAVPSVKKNPKGNHIHVKSYHDHDVSSSSITTTKTLPERNSTEKLKKNIELKSVYEIDEANKAEKKERRGSWGILEANLVVPEESTSTSTTSSTTEPISTVAQTKRAQHTWEHLEMSISPITKEKVYVVTPMSLWNPDTTPTPHHVYNRFLPQSQTKASRTLNSSSYNLPTTPNPSPTFERDSFPFRNDVGPRNKSSFSFHSPRFLVRPTPGVNLQRTSVTSEQPDRRFSEEDNSVSYIHETNFDHRKSTSSIGNTPDNTSLKSILPVLTDIPVYTPPEGSRVHTITGHSKLVLSPEITTPHEGSRVHTITGHSKHKVVTLPTTPSTSSRRKWTGYDAIRPTTSAPDDPESFLQSLAKLLTSGNGPTLPPGETVGGSISAAVREAQKNHEQT